MVVGGRNHRPLMGGERNPGATDRFDIFIIGPGNTSTYKYCVNVD